MKRSLLFSLTFLLAVFSRSAFSQQSGSIKGKITTADGQPAALVSIGLKNKNQSTATNENGEYVFARIKAGSYTLKVSAVGINTQEKTITLAAGETAILNFVLTENSETLKEVSIQARKNKYKIGTPSSSLRLNEPVLEAPQNIQIVSNEVLADQQVISMGDGLIRNVSGAVRMEHWGDLYTNITMRGSQIQAMRNGFNVVASFWGPLTEDMSFVDHIEFVKGPAGFMLGNGDPSGMYNVVTKKPMGTNTGEVGFTLGSYDLYRTTVDFDRKITADGKLLFRLNTAVQNRGSFRPYEQNDRYSFAPSLSYQITNSTKFTATYTLQNAKMTELGSYYVFGTDQYAKVGPKFTMTQPGVDPTRIKDHSLFLNLTQNLGDKWKVTAQAAYFRYLQTGTSSWPTSVSKNGDVIRNASIWDAESTMKLGQLFINGEAKTGGITHRILAGFDGGKKEYFADWGQSHNLDLPTAPFNIYRPNYGYPSNGYPNFDRSKSVKERAIAIGGLMDQKYLSGYIQEEMGFFANRLRLTLAGRYTYVNQSSWGAAPDKANKITPRVGLSVSIDKNTAVYGVYDQSFTPQSGILRNGATPDPITGTNTEFGLKKDWFDGKWNTTLSVYRILKQNELTADPSNGTRPDGSKETYSIAFGEKRAQGVEFDLRGEIIPGLKIIANYAYTDSKVTKVTPGVTGFTVGDVVPGFAKHVANSWLSYDIPNGALKGAGVSAGFTYMADRATDTWSVGLQKLPNYFKLDGGIYYGRDKIRITANAFNILNRYLYSGSYYAWLNAYYWQAESPRNYRLSIAYKF